MACFWPVWKTKELFFFLLQLLIQISDINFRLTKNHSKLLSGILKENLGSSPPKATVENKEDKENKENKQDKQEHHEPEKEPKEELKPNIKDKQEVANPEQNTIQLELILKEITFSIFEADGTNVNEKDK